MLSSQAVKLAVVVVALHKAIAVQLAGLSSQTAQAVVLVADAVLVVAEPFLVDSAVMLGIVAPVAGGLAAVTAAALGGTTEVVVVKAQGGAIGIGLFAQLTNAPNVIKPNKSSDLFGYV